MNGGGRDDDPDDTDGRGGRRTKRRGGKENPRKRNEFKGTIKDIGGHVFQTFSESDNKTQFGRTCEELEWCINHTLDSPSDLLSLYTKHEMPEIPEPKELGKEDKKSDMKKYLE